MTTSSRVWIPQRRLGFVDLAELEPFGSVQPIFRSMPFDGNVDASRRALATRLEELEYRIGLDALALVGPPVFVLAMMLAASDLDPGEHVVIVRAHRDWRRSTVLGERQPAAERGVG